MKDLISCTLAVIFIAIGSGILCLWAGIMFELMYDALMIDGTIRSFTIFGTVAGGVVGAILVAWNERAKKQNG